MVRWLGRHVESFTRVEQKYTFNCKTGLFGSKNCNFMNCCFKNKNTDVE